MTFRDDLILFGRKLAPAPAWSTEPDWRQADPAWIRNALHRALALPSGGWYVVDASRVVRSRPRRARVAGRDLVVWRAGRAARVAPDACPHMGASLAEGHVHEGRLVCPWHGLRLGEDPHGGWRPFPVHDDGVLVWVRMGPEKDATAAPILPPRPPRYLDAVVREEAGCEPEDVLANRLDPWHGAHYHPHSFGRLQVLEQGEDAITVRVVYRVAGRLGIEVDARFHCPEPRTIVMTIVGGEGVGSVVETHATPVEPGRTAIIEATLATSDRPRFWTITGALSGMLRSLVRWRARRLWVEDATYAERRYALRSRGDDDSGGRSP